MTSQPSIAVGAPLARVDGRLKVTGTALYAADHPTEYLLYAAIVDATIGRGRIAGIDTDAALAHDGVQQVISHLNASKLAYAQNSGSNNPPGNRLQVFQNDRVLFFGQPVAVVIAESLEAARHGAELVTVSYEAQRPDLDLNSAAGDKPESYARGDAEGALLSSAVQLEMSYVMARNHHNPMEPHATIASWDGERLTLWDKTQWVVDGTQKELASVFGIPAESIRVISPFVGGAFGSALRAWPHVTVAALAARESRRPVKLVLSRRQLYFGTGFRPAYTYTVRLGSARDGRLTAMTHEIRSETSSYERFTEEVLAPGQMLYSTPNVSQTYVTVPLNVNTPIWMRGPGMATAVLAVESAMDELATELSIDPIDLRLRNEPGSDESSGLPFSSRRLRECYTVGAREFGWQQRTARPRATTDGNWLVGTGVATAIYGSPRSEAQAHVRLNADGAVAVQAASSDMGPGTYTSMTQVAADALGVPVDRVQFSLGDSTMPPTPPHGGSMTMASVGSAVQIGADTVRERAIALAVGDAASPLYGVGPQNILVRNGRLEVGNDARRGETYRELLARNGRSHLETIGTFTPPTENGYSMYGYGAVFAEVGVDAALGVIRVRRMLSVYDAGRIINPRLAESQAIGGMVGGIGKALLEETVTDPRDGRIVNANLSDYLVPVNADIPDLRAIYLPNGNDQATSVIGVKGLAELVMVGIAPAIANAVFNATGRRVRSFPITADALL